MDIWKNKDRFGEELKWKDSYPFGIPAVLALHDRIVRRLEVLGWPELAAFFSPLLARYARWAMDLPGSERHHHAFPYGLLLHSAETVDRAFALGENMIRCLPLPWLKVLVVLALLHDCGRLFDLVVRCPRSGDLWNPLEESLFGFRAARYLPLEGGGEVAWRPGRGLDGHERHLADFPSVLLRSAEREPIRDLLPTAVSQYRWRSSREEIWVYLEANLVAEVVAAADLSNARSDWARLRRNGKGLHPEGDL
jgi:hypothetical protein